MRLSFLYTPWCLILILYCLKFLNGPNISQQLILRMLSIQCLWWKKFLFTFEDPTQPASQLTWTVLPHGFCDSPHLFGQSLSQDLQNFNSSQVVVIQYVDDILLCAETEEACA